jgi:poly(3-hydroxybutyrate) depolymerase
MKTLLTIGCAVLITTSAFAANVTKESLASGGKLRTYYLFVPDRTDGVPAPLIVLLHGSGRNGKIMVDHWQKLAQKEGIVLAGPDSIDSQMWSYPVDGPDFLRDVVEAVKSRTAIDPRRVYLFGHSAGACFALQLSVLESEYFAATAIHAGALGLGDLGMVDSISRKIPIFIQVGTDDSFFPLMDVRRTRDAFEKNGVPVELREIRRHDHNYYVVSKDVNDKAWTFLKAKVLEREPKYVQYTQ